MHGSAERLLMLGTGALFLAVLCAVLGAAAVYAARMHERAAALRRVRAMQGAAVPVAAAGPHLRKAGAKGRGPRALAVALRRLAGQAGLGAGEARLLLVGPVMSLAVVAVGVGALAPRMNTPPGGVPLLVFVALALALALFIPIAILRQRAATRRRQFVEQLPAALDIMKRLVRAGHPVQAALATVGQEMPGPVGRAFAATANEVAYGLDLREALAHLGRRMAVPELRYLIVAMNVQHETGGNLVAILDRLAQLIRARFRLHKKVRVLSAEARLSAWLLALMPLAFAAMIFLTRPEVYLDVAGDPLVLPLVLAAALLQLTGVLVMRWLMRFKV